MLDGGDDLARLVAHGRGDRVQPCRELLVVDRQARLEHLLEFVAQRLLAR